ncbi:MAG: hypothetical protein IJ506_06050 [Clostridia bacterium]|nr:hypothetical protein [Clostridia bacterium]
MPYVGVWIDYGTVNGSYYVGLEPCTVGYDTVLKAEQYGQRRILKCEESIKFCIALSVIDE